NSGPLDPEVSAGIQQGDLVALSVLSGNRNFEGRVHAEIRGNYLASPPLVVAYALAGRMDVDLYSEPLGTGSDGQPVFLEDIWPSRREVQETVQKALQSEMFRRTYAEVFEGSEQWKSMPVPEGVLYEWDPESTYVKHPPFFEGLTREPAPVEAVSGARALAHLGDSVTTDHISPAGAIKKDSPAGRYLIEHGVEPPEFNSYGSRRGNHEVMMRGTFANVRLRNKLVPGVEGGYTRHIPSGEQMSIYDAAMRYQEEGTPLVVLGGIEYGSGSSRDWAAKGTRLLGIRAVIAQSFERIHRSNLIGMGVLPLEFPKGESAESLGLGGDETFDVESPEGKRQVRVTALKPEGATVKFDATVRIDTPQEFEYYRHGGILHYVLRQLAQG
ncbi:MAG: aconitase family protein, partial [Gemmatimonadales bacterium]